MRIPVAIVVLLFCGLLAVVGSSQANAKERPHVVCIVADDLRADLLSVYGGPVPTPNLERLAARGCRFDRVVCGYPICHVSRTEILTGRAMVAEASAGGAIPFQPEWASLPRVMQRAGWQTVHVGKWHVRGKPRELGYDRTTALYSSGGSGGEPLTFPRSATDRPVTGYRGWTFKTDDEEPVRQWGIGLTPDTDRRIADGAIEVIDTLPSEASDPMLLHVNFTAPHDPLHWPAGMENRYSPRSTTLPSNFRPEHPFDHGNAGGRDEMIVPPPRTSEDVRRQRAVYFALAEQIDIQVGRICEALQRRGMLEDTVILFTSDQGIAIGSHGLMGKQNQYEHTANVPLLLAGPGVPAGVRTTSQGALRDLFPTVCQLCDLPVPTSVQGASLLTAIDTESSTEPRNVHGYFTDTQRMIRSADDWKLIWYPKLDRYQLFHVASDPDERNDQINNPAHGDRQQELRAELVRWLREHRDPVATAIE